MAALLGFEPRQSDSESLVLPLHYKAISRVNLAVVPLAGAHSVSPPWADKEKMDTGQRQTDWAGAERSGSRSRQTIGNRPTHHPKSAASGFAKVGKKCRFQRAKARGPSRIGLRCARHGRRQNRSRASSRSPRDVPLRLREWSGCDAWRRRSPLRWRGRRSAHRC